LTIQIRLLDTISGLAGVLDFAFGDWRVRPVESQYDYTFTGVNPRTDAPEQYSRPW